MLGYLHRRRLRVGLRLDPKGPLFRLVDEAHAAAHSLSVALRYRSCRSGIGLRLAPTSQPRPWVMDWRDVAAG
jgi:hypothetical protein